MLFNKTKIENDFKCCVKAAIQNFEANFQRKIKIELNNILLNYARSDSHQLIYRRNAIV